MLFSKEKVGSLSVMHPDVLDSETLGIVSVKSLYSFVTACQGRVKSIICHSLQMVFGALS